jgi:ABC-type uncharacterized transport system involved in gliding motility auxiliary subunit
MPRRRAKLRSALLATLAALLAAAAGACVLAGGERERPTLGLLTSLPIYWSESFDIAERIDGEAPAHWARGALEEEYDLSPLDTLDTLRPSDSRSEAPDLLLLAQPRPLSPSENVALDEWVRAGGRVLIFADPMLTAHSRFSIGDRRRPQDVVLLSPILRRWGLELTYDPDQPAGDRRVALGEGAIAVSQAGAFAKVAASAPAACTLEADGLVADCRIGEGRALVVADAALFDQEREPGEARNALEVITARAFGD